MLIIFAGLPGVGKSTLARELAREIGAVYLRIDSIEEALGGGQLEDGGYRVAYAVAEDNLKLGRTVIADCVNPIGLTREAWRSVAERCGVGAVEVEVICSDLDEHRQRAEARNSPSWSAILSREYHCWDREHIVIDTAGQTLAQSLHAVHEALGTQKNRAPGEHPKRGILNSEF